MPDDIVGGDIEIKPRESKDGSWQRVQQSLRKNSIEAATSKDKNVVPTSLCVVQPFVAQPDLGVECVTS